MFLNKAITESESVCIVDNPLVINANIMEVYNYWYRWVVGLDDLIALFQP